MRPIIGAQYYRPPFPRSDKWRSDLEGMREAGLDAVQLWLVWGWIEAKPGEYRFEDYDELIEIAGQVGLKVVLSTIAAVQPNWIHRVVPGSEMVTNMGQKVVSTSRRECHFGITPGGCIDHPGVWSRMAAFMRTCAERYRSRDELFGWDVWNELRWNVHADGLVCYCEHTVEAFRRWLDGRFGGLDGLNDAWERRYSDWADVFPGKRPGRVYTEMMAFEEFLTMRSVEHAVARYDTVAAADPDHPATVHGGKPSVLYGDDSYWREGEASTALHRGNDWFFADRIDGVGCSSFPIWEKIDHADFIARIDYVRSARSPRRGTKKRLWLSELQGGRSASGYSLQEPVDSASQQRWLWSGLAAGAESVLFWCWRDEIFGHESAGFGISGNDGHAAERIAAFRKSGRLLSENPELFEGYSLDEGSVGVLFSPGSYYQNWAQEGDALRCMNAIKGYVRALVKQSIPFRVIEEHHLDFLDAPSEIELLFLPRVLVVDEELADGLSQWVRAGGTLVVESECGAFASNGVYREPQERFLARLTAGAAEEVGRRSPDTGATAGVTVDRAAYRLPYSGWFTPFEDGTLTAEVAVGKGRVIALGLFAGEAYYAAERGVDGRGRETRRAESTSAASGAARDEATGTGAPGFEELIGRLCAVHTSSPPPYGIAPRSDSAPGDLRHVRWGSSVAGEIVSVVSTLPGDEPLLTTERPHGRFREIISGRELAADGQGRLGLPASDWGCWCLVRKE